MMRLYRLMSDRRHQHLWQKPSGEPKTHHRRDCPHCCARGYKVGCVLPFQHIDIVPREESMYGLWKTSKGMR